MKWTVRRSLPEMSSKSTDGIKGVVIAAIDDKSYQAGAEDWEYLASGAMIDTHFAGLAHYPADGAELVLVRRCEQ